MAHTPPALVALALLVATPALAQPTPDPAAPASQWFKGNTHCHAKTWLPIPHGDSTPQRMLGWYKEHGYQFVCLSDHNHTGRERRAADLIDAGFVCITGSEITTDTRIMPLYERRHPGAPTRVLHTTALGIDAARWDTDVWKAFDETSSVADILRRHRAATEAAGGVTILNHPNFREPVTADEVIAAGVHLFEVYNAYPHSRNFGDGQRPSTDALWDAVLSRGHRLYGVASDDAHHTKRWNRWLTEETGIRAEPGGGFIMVRARSLDVQSIMSAIAAGEFYASSGVHLATLEVDADRYALSVDAAATAAEVANDWVWDPAVPAAPGEQPGIRIELVSQNGQVVRAVDGTTAEIRLDQVTGYVRARVRVVAIRDGQARAFYAWTQPKFVAPPAPTHGVIGGLGQ